MSSFPSYSEVSENKPATPAGVLYVYQFYHMYFYSLAKYEVKGMTPNKVQAEFEILSIADVESFVQNEDNKACSFRI